jgi:5-methyltetrahydrofolate--homocysteine methyltransferase
VASGKDNALVTLETVKRLKAKGYKCILGVSNVSFGLPERDLINSTFYTATLFAGLDLAIINPESEAMMRAYRAYNALSANDEGCKEYVEFTLAHSGAGKTVEKAIRTDLTLAQAVEKGLKADAKSIAEELIKTREPLDIINAEIIPALDKVGEGFENKTVYLPGLLASAEAANSAFSVLKSKMPVSQSKNERKIVLATVKNDIHDIGKNIVKLIFESYGYEVIDLGRDVPTDVILKTLADSGAELLGLSALMTTTLPSMEEAVARVRSEFPGVKIIVGGAVLTGTYAERIGADFYAPDAMAGVRYADGMKKA